MILFLACFCAKQSTTPPPKEPTVTPSIPVQKTELKPSSPKEIPLLEISTSQSLPEGFQKKWPPQEWSYAKAYTFNFVPYGPGNSNYVYKKDTWNKNTPVSYAINNKQAEYALKLVHKTAGDVETSKCTFPRHGIVYFNEQDTPIASINYCFSCEAVLLWPAYLSFEERLERESLAGTKVEGQEWVDPQVVQIYYDLVPAYKHLFFEQLKMPEYTAP